MDWDDPLRHLAPISDHPAKKSTTLTSELAIITDEELGNLKVDVLLNHFGQRGERHNRAANILLSFFQFLEDEGRRILGMEIRDFIENEEDMFQFANHLVQAILLPFKASGGKAPPPLTPMPIFANAHEIEEAMIFIEPSKREQAKLKQDCLRRDGYQCVYTGDFDLGSIRDKKIIPPEGSSASPTECGHIIPFALGNFDGRNSVETQNKAVIWWTLYRYFPALQGKINSESINQRENAITLTLHAHVLFGKFDLRFWPQEDIQNSYETSLTMDLPTGFGYSAKPKSGSAIIQLEQHDPNIPMPNPEYLKVHHAVSQVVTVSGIGDEIDSVLEAAELDDTNLDPNGSSDIRSLVFRKMLIHEWV